MFKLINKIVDSSYQGNPRTYLLTYQSEDGNGFNTLVSKDEFSKLQDKYDINTMPHEIHVKGYVDSVVYDNGVLRNTKPVNYKSRLILDNFSNLTQSENSFLVRDYLIKNMIIEELEVNLSTPINKRALNNKLILYNQRFTIIDIQ